MIRTSTNTRRSANAKFEPGFEYKALPTTPEEAGFASHGHATPENAIFPPNSQTLLPTPDTLITAVGSALHSTYPAGDGSVATTPIRIGILDGEELISRDANRMSKHHCRRRIRREIVGQDGASLSPHIMMDRRILREIAFSFLRLGVTALGGPAAHIAMMEDEFVRRRGWLSRDEFLDMLGATNLIPGPNSTEMAIHIGHRRAGWQGLVVGGVCFIVPAMLIVLAAAWAYVRFGSLPQAQGIMYGVKPVIIAIVLQALWRLAPGAVKSGLLAVIGLIATVAALLGVNTLVVLFGAGVITAGAAWINQRRFAEVAGAAAAIRWPAILPVLKSASATAAIVPFSLLGLFLFFLKVGAVLYGSGYVLLAFLQADLVSGRHWMTQSQLLDAVAIGQVTPGPVFTTATFIGYLLGGWPGAIVATIGIFAPSFLFVAASRPLIPRIRRSPLAGALLDGVNIGALALTGAVMLQLSRAALVDPTTVAVAAISALLLICSETSSARLIFAGGLVGLAAAQ